MHNSVIRNVLSDNVKEMYIDSEVGLSNIYEMYVTFVL